MLRGLLEFGIFNNRPIHFLYQHDSAENETESDVLSDLILDSEPNNPLSTCPWLRLCEVIVILCLNGKSTTDVQVTKGLKSRLTIAKLDFISAEK